MLTPASTRPPRLANLVVALFLLLTMLAATTACGVSGLEAYNAGVSAANDGRLKEAESQFRTATAQNPEFAEAWMNLGIVYMLMADEAVRDGAGEIDTRRFRELYEKAYKNLLTARDLIEQNKTIRIRGMTEDTKWRTVQERLRICEEYLGEHATRDRDRD